MLAYLLILTDSQWREFVLSYSPWIILKGTASLREYRPVSTFMLKSMGVLISETLIQHRFAH